MKVVHVITRLIIGGAQENTLLTVEDQRRDYGDDVSLICGPGLGPEGSLVKRAQAGNFDLRILPQLRRSIHPWRDWSSYRELLRILKQLKPQIVHTHSSKAGILGRAAAAKLGISAVHTIHGASFHYGQHRFAFGLYKQAEKWADRWTDKFISVCDAMTNQYVDAGIAARDKFVTIYSGMKVEQFLKPPRPREEVRKELGFQPQHVVIGKVARLFDLKGHEFVIKAAAPVIARNPNVRFLFVGDGALRHQFEQQIAQENLTEHFVFTGLISPDRIAEQIGAMDIAVHTSLWEGLARVLPQALIAAKPVVSYDVDGAREVAVPGKTGYLLPPKSVNELAEALCDLASDSELRQRLGQNGRARFTEQFRHQSTTRQIREVYKALIDE